MRKAFGGVVLSGCTRLDEPMDASCKEPQVDLFGFGDVVDGDDWAGEIDEVWRLAEFGDLDSFHCDC
jgi:hypothetical protein